MARCVITNLGLLTLSSRRESREQRNNLRDVFRGILNEVTPNVVLVHRPEVATKGEPLSGVEVLGVVNGDNEADALITRIQARVPLPTEVRWTYMTMRAPRR